MRGMLSATLKMDMHLEKLDNSDSVILESSFGQRTCLKLEDLSLELEALNSVDSSMKFTCENDSHEHNLPLDKRQLLCSFCNKTFVQLQALINHRLTHVGERRPYKCHSCKKAFTQLDYLKKHIQMHDQQRPYSCSLCYQPFHRLCDLQRHLVMHTGETPYQCDECGKMFSNYYSKNRHELSHNGEKSLKCNSCDKTFYHIEYLKKHMVMHTGERPYTCDICKKTFPRVSSLRSHRMTHTGEKPYKCDSCDKTFNQSSSMKRHKLLHSGLKPYKCEFCDRAFTESDKLKIHLTTHTGDKPYRCGLCDKTFSRLFKLRRHMVSHRSKSRFCDKSFTENCRLKIRTSTMQTETECASEKTFKNLHNSKILERRLVQKLAMEDFTDVVHSQESTKNYEKTKFFRDISYLESSEDSSAKNMKTEDLLQLEVIEVEQETEVTTGNAEEILCKDNCNRKSLNDKVKIINLNSGERRFMCAICNRTYTRLYDLNRHQVTHTGEMPYKCDSCGKSFAYFTSMKRHAIIHTGEKPYSCELCGKAFSQIEYLKKHMVVHAKSEPYSDDTCEERSSKLPDYKRTQMEETPNKHESCQKTCHSSADKEHVAKGHSCSFCPRKFSRLNVLKKHVLIHAKEKPYVCYTCEQRFKEPHELIAHIGQHNGEEPPYYCSLCEISVPYMIDAKNHALLHFKSRPFKTSLSYKRLSKLQRLFELELCTEKKSSTRRSCKKKCEAQKRLMVCSRVGNPFKLFYNNVEMIDSHRSNTNGLYSCSTCGKPFSTLYRLTRHLKIHSEAVYMCYLCDARFARASCMKVHIYKHIGIKPYNCSICDLEFSSIVDLRSHLTSHTQDREHRCCSIDKPFSNEEGLMKKHSTKHLLVEPILCKQAFSQLSELEKQQGTQSSERLHELSSHAKAHNIAIQDDGPSSCENIRNGLEYHENKYSWSTNENLFENTPCKLHDGIKVSNQSICTLEFSSERPYACGICFEGFQTKSDVAEHFDSYGGANACSKFSVALSQTQSA